MRKNKMHGENQTVINIPIRYNPLLLILSTVVTVVAIYVLYIYAILPLGEVYGFKAPAQEILTVIVFLIFIPVILSISRSDAPVYGMMDTFYGMTDTVGRATGINLGGDDLAEYGVGLDTYEEFKKLFIKLKQSDKLSKKMGFLLSMEELIYALPDVKKQKAIWICHHLRKELSREFSERAQRSA